MRNCFKDWRQSTIGRKELIPCSFFLQFMSEKIGGAKGTELDDDFTEMERVSFLCFFFQLT